MPTESDNPREPDGSPSRSLNALNDHNFEQLDWLGNRCHIKSLRIVFSREYRIYCNKTGKRIVGGDPFKSFDAAIERAFEIEHTEDPLQLPR